MISSRVTHCQQPGSSIGTQLRAKLFREEPEAGNLHIRVGPLGQEPRLGLQPFADDVAGEWIIRRSARLIRRTLLENP
jgi:hypothetical protein